MQGKTLAKLAGFGIAAACTAGLIGFAANGTGAYFTGSAPGSFNVSTGTIEVHGTTQLSGLDFTNLEPGIYRTQTVTYNTTATGSEDVYLELPNDPALTGVSAPGPAPLGRYGHFAVTSTAGTFSSFNLAGDPNFGTANQDTTDCVVDPNTGLGGNQTTAATSKTDFSNGFCPAPQFILLKSGITKGGNDQSVKITFGFTPLLSNTSGGTTPVDEQGSDVASMPFDLVAVQHGQSPSDPLNSPGSSITPQP